MPALCSLITLLILTGLAVALLWTLWSAGALVFARRKLMMVLVGLPVSVGVVVLLFVGMWVYTSRPAYIFEREFGFPPPPGTVITEASASAFGDSGSAHLQFSVTPTTLARLTAGYTLDPSYPGPKVRYIRDGRGRPGGFASEQRKLIYDPTTGTAIYNFTGVD